MTSSTVPTKIDHYNILEEIGTGAMGIVYRVHDTKLLCDRALKVLRSELIEEADTVARFRAEGRAAVKASGAIAHPNIVTVYDSGEYDGRPYIVMELFSGLSLDTVMEAGEETLSIKAMLRIAAQLAGALASAHTHGVVHRDIKPANILYSEDSGMVKLTDFSVARVKRDDDHALTRTGVVIGAPRYMSPEQALGKTADGRSDLYGLGVVLYELLTGQKAFRSDTITALLIEITQNDPEPIRKLNKNVSPRLERIVTRLLEKDPERRFENGKQLQLAIRCELSDLNAEDAKAQKSMPIELLGAGLLGLSVALLLGVTSLIIRDRQIDALQDQAATIGVAYAQSMARQISQKRSDDPDFYGTHYSILFEELEPGSEIAFHRIVLSSDEIISSANPHEVGTNFERKPAISQVGSSGSSEIIQLDDKSKILRVEQGIEFKGSKFATIFVGFPLDEIEKISRITFWLMTLMTLLVASLVGLITFFLIKRFSEPLEKIRDGLTAIADGNYDFRMVASKTGLIGQAYEAYNEAATAIANLGREPNLANLLSDVEGNTENSCDESVENNGLTDENVGQSNTVKTSGVSLEDDKTQIFKP